MRGAAVRTVHLIVAMLIRLWSEPPVSDAWKRDVDVRLIRGDSGKSFKDEPARRRARVTRETVWKVCQTLVHV